ncbi:MAG: MaoC/PaaZ C-terminal domain-containing protein [Anaerolineales bacterium]
MTPTSPAQRGMYFEEFKVGHRILTAGRTVTESDIVLFAGLSGDFNQIHIDAEFSKASPFGARVAHGLLGLSIASGLVVQTGFMEGTIMAFREVNEWKFIKPIYIGDTIHVETEVKETKAIPRIRGGSIIISLDVKNQTGETLMKGTWTALIASRPANPS